MAKKPKAMTAAQRQKKARRAVRVSKLMAHAAWSRAVRDRDGNKCVRCGATYTAQAHHWYVGKRACHECATDPDNGITLCLACHELWIHRQGTYAIHYDILLRMMRILGVKRYLALVARAKVCVTRMKELLSPV